MNARTFTAVWLLTVSLTLGATNVLAQSTPARLKSGDAPAPPPNAVGWTWDVVDLTVNAGGRPDTWHGLFSTNGWAGFVWKVANSWSFDPARNERGPIASHVLIAACYRPAALSTGPESQPPGVSASREVPTPTTLVPPAYPPRALGDGVVILELRVDTTGAIMDARVVRSASGFDEAALVAARKWRFQAAQRDGVAVPAYIYLIFGFRQPVTPAEPASGSRLRAAGMSHRHPEDVPGAWSLKPEA